VRKCATEVFYFAQIDLMADLPIIKTEGVDEEDHVTAVHDDPRVTQLMVIKTETIETIGKISKAIKLISGITIALSAQVKPILSCSATMIII
jgi:hypothetical protein